MKALAARVAYEPALVAGVILAVANLFGHDGSALAETVETVIVLAASVAVRQRVTPVAR